MTTEAKIAIVVMIVIVLVAVYSAYTQLTNVEDLKAFHIQEDAMKCIEDYGNASACVEICEGTLNDNTYLYLKDLDGERCRHYLTELVD